MWWGGGGGEGWVFLQMFGQPADNTLAENFSTQAPIVSSLEFPCCRLLRLQ